MRKNLLIKLLVLLWAGASPTPTMAQNPMERLLGPDAAPVIFWTWNATYMGTVGVLSGGNLTFSASSGGNGVVIATLPGGTTGKTGGDYYWEATITTLGNNMSIGLEASLSPNLNTWMGADANGYGYYSLGTSVGSWLAGTISFSPPPADAFNNGDVVGIMYKGSTNQIKMYLLHSGITTLEATFSVAPGSYFPAMSNKGGSATANFGQNPWQLSGAPFSASGWAN